MEDTAHSIWTPQRMMTLRDPGSVHPSPDGQRAVFTLREAVMEPERSEYMYRIYVSSATGGDPVTAGEISATDPAWSPDGVGIAFLSHAAGKKDVWLVDAAGGQPRQLTGARTGVSSFRWSPDGAWIAYTAIDPASPEEEQAAREKVDARVVGANPRMQRLYVLPVGAALAGRGQARCLTAGNYTVGVADIAAVYNWTPDGKTIIFNHTRTPCWDDWLSAGISRVDVDSGVVRPLLCEAPPAIDPHVSPDGRWVACKIYDEPGWEWSSVVHLLPLDGGPPRPLAATADRRPDIVGWSADSRRVLYVESWGTRTRICALPVDGDPPEVVYAPEGVLSAVALSRSGTACGFVLETPSRPPEAYASRLDAWHPVQLSRANEALGERPPGHTEVIRWTADDGLEIEGLLTTPLDHRPGSRCPLLLSVHGGPANVFSQTYVGRPSIYGPLAALVARGYAVLRPNYRGSTGYGKAFRRANYRDWGGRSLRDLLAGVDHVVAMGVADPQRLGILGWSHGGYLAAWAITQTRRFRAAVVGAGMSNLVSYAGTTDSPGFVASHFGGEVWEVGDLLSARSPVFHAGAVTTPTLILHGEDDARVPISQGSELCNALRRAGTEVQMVTYPHMGHVPSEPKLLKDVMARTAAWLDRHVLA